VGPLTPSSDSLVDAAKRLRDAANEITFAPPVSHIYNPLDYAWAAHESYLRRYGNGCKRVLFLGMNPGPFGMVQTGVPFGQITAVRDWLGIETDIARPKNEHPERPILGFACQRSEISGKRLWGLLAARFGSAQNFFRDHFVANYSPLAFLEASGRNRTPDKLPPAERKLLFVPCDEHLRAVVRALQPESLIGIGYFATKRIEEIFPGNDRRIGRILHPSPACPESNLDWANKATAQLQKLGVW
jgi:single-strand selective monofunctional uracil DNA glycosylase